MKYGCEIKEIHVKKGDFILVGNELLQVKELKTDSVIVKDGREINCTDIIDVKEWEE